MSAIHPDVLALIERVRQAESLPFEKLSPQEARRVHAERARAMQTEGDSLEDVRDMRAAGQGHEVPLRFYRATRAEDGPSPCLLFLHGGGWVLGSLDTHDWVCRRLARELGACVLAVDYRLAPEHPYPAALEDGIAALRWLAAQAEVLGIDPRRIAVGGDSAGANLAAVLALMGREGHVPPTVFQMLLYPAVDLDIDENSYAPVTEAMLLAPTTMRYFIEQYLPAPEQRRDWRASPLRAPSLRGAPPALVLTCGHDPLGEEGRRYARRLEQDGVAVTALHLSDQTHGFLTMNKAIRPVAGVMAFAAQTLRGVW
ncbi:alpha/beta hydrolase [Roseomonas marmotae]|uniref:Alpha/beta hydrolase n=1 Tax=Roseomonas marmotae TaxID=2768161 RepID=A0ABS3KEG5_9PROT|nr:alpha/beta hydrolase [Roseomonas marmotae]MBO1075849.1 alpha/beta hydrolase [Roseomonas marmotae]QTI81960.1 alpha/beta hydrolase [Roseomonas marmotae]